MTSFEEVFGGSRRHRTGNIEQALKHSRRGLPSVSLGAQAKRTSAYRTPGPEIRMFLSAGKL